VRCASTGAERRGGGLCADPAYVVIPQAKKTQKTRDKKKSQKTTDRLFFFLGAPCVGCGPSVDMPPHVGTRSWLWGLPLRASSL
jgi:hypothetical protein